MWVEYWNKGVENILHKLILFEEKGLIFINPQNIVSMVTILMVYG